MNKRSIIEQITTHGAVAAQTIGRNVDIERNVPVRATLSTPFYMKKESLRKGDKIAVVDMDAGLAFICVVSKTETRGASKTQVVYLEKAKKIKLES